MANRIAPGIAQVYSRVMPPRANDAPEAAIAAFERLTGLMVTVHDLCGSLHGRIASRRATHTQAICRQVQSQHAMACIRFDVDHLRAVLPSRPDGLVKRCHAGMVELAVPVLGPHSIDWILMAGGRRPGSGLRDILLPPGQAPVHGAWEAKVSALSSLDVDEATSLLESFRQLAARLRELVPTTAGHALDGRLSREAPSLVPAWIAAHHARDVRLADLATHLRLSPSRTSAIVRQVCGRPFQELLIEARLNTAASLLMQTALSVADVARGAGFRNLANFHRSFVRHYGASPAMWRRTRPLRKKT